MGKQIDKLASFIIREMAEKITESESAVDTAIRIMCSQMAEISDLKERIRNMTDHPSMRP